MTKKNEEFRSNLLSVVSHELNTPLTSIINAIAMLEEKFPKEQEYLPMLRRNSERLRKTVENLMELSQADAGVLRVRLSEMHLGNFIHLRKQLLKPEMEAQKFSLEVKIEEDLPNICADTRRLARAFDSLVRNAVKFSDTGHGTRAGKVRVHLSMESIDLIPETLRAKGLADKTNLCLVVAISSSLPALGDVPENFEQLFEPFSPWRDVNSRQKDGLGVELALAREILMAHQGYIWASNPEESGEGWVFRFALPVLSRSDELDLVINNRLFGELSSLSKISLLMLRPEPGSLQPGREQVELGRSIEKILFRSSDSIFWVPETGELTILMDDCDQEGAAKVAQRMIVLLRAEKPKMSFVWATVTAPDDAVHANDLQQIARTRWLPAD